jgi:hypothetical protein
MADLTVQAAREELDTARHVGDRKRIAAAKLALAAVKQAALPKDEQQD